MTGVRLGRRRGRGGRRRRGRHRRGARHRLARGQRARAPRRRGVRRDALAAGRPASTPPATARRWPNPLFDEEVRIEHWTNAAEQGAAAAANLLAVAAGERADAVRAGAVLLEQAVRRPDPVPRPGRRRRRGPGRPRLGRERQVRGPLRAPTGRLHGALGVSLPKLVMAYRKLLEPGDLGRCPGPRRRPARLTAHRAAGRPAQPSRIRKLIRDDSGFLSLFGSGIVTLVP